MNITHALQRGMAALPDLHVSDSSEAMLSGRKPPFRLLVRAAHRDGRKVNIRHAVSEGFVVSLLAFYLQCLLQLVYWCKHACGYVHGKLLATVQHSPHVFRSISMDLCFLCAVCKIQQFELGAHVLPYQCKLLLA